MLCSTCLPRGWPRTEMGVRVPVAARGRPPEVSMVTASWHCSICTIQHKCVQCCSNIHIHIKKTVLDYAAVAKAASDSQIAGNGICKRFGCMFFFQTTCICHDRQSQGWMQDQVVGVQASADFNKNDIKQHDNSKRMILTTIMRKATIVVIKVSKQGAGC